MENLQVIKFLTSFSFPERIVLNDLGALYVDLVTRFNITNLTLLWVVFFGFALQGGSGVKLPRPKLVEIMKLSTHIYVLSENIPLLLPFNLFPDVSFFVVAKISFFAKNSTFTQSSNIGSVLEIF